MSETSGLMTELIRVLDMVRSYGSRASASGLTRLQLLELALVAERVAAEHAAELDGHHATMVQSRVVVNDGVVSEEELVELRA